jgi:hypothetical protein
MATHRSEFFQRGDDSVPAQVAKDYSGTSDNLSAEECRDELRGFLNVLCEEPPEPELVGLELCPTIDAIVVCVEKKRLKTHAFIPPSNSSGRGLHHAIGFKGSDLASLAEMLWRQHHDAILSLRFSREPTQGADHNEYEWAPFSASESARVRRILGISETISGENGRRGNQ